MTVSIFSEPPRVPLVDIKTGKATREGYLFLQWLVNRGGTLLAPTNTQLQEALEQSQLGGNSLAAGLEAQAQADAQAAALVPLPQPALPPADGLSPADVAELRERVTRLERAIQDLQQGTML